MADADLRVLTLNVWGRRGDWEARRAVLVAGLRELRPDLVALQETIVHEGYDQAAELLGRGFHVAHQAARAEDGQGVSIASRWPIGELRELALHLTPRTAGFPCTTLAAGIEAPEPLGPLVFVNHFPSWQLQLERERELQAVTAARFLERLSAERARHVIVCGDLDADPEASSIRFWCGRQALDGTSVCYRDAWEAVHPGEPGDTFSPENPLMAGWNWDWPFRRIDYVLVRCGEHGGPTLRVDRCERVFASPVDGVWASDHFGVVAELAVPAKRGASFD